MTINHVFLRVSASNFAATRAFYMTALSPLGYKQMITVSPTYVGIGSDYPYLFLKALPAGKEAVPTHMAFDAPSTRSVPCFSAVTNAMQGNMAVDEFYTLGL